MEGTRAVGVEILHEGSRERLHASRVTISAGAVGTPAILLRSGIGPADELRGLGIAPVADLQGVGRNLVDHARIELGWPAPPALRDEAAPYFQVLLRHTAPDSAVANDMQILSLQAPTKFLLMPTLMKPLSAGRLRLRSRDPSEQPDIRLKLASHPEDARRLRESIRLVAALAATPELGAMGSEAMMLDTGETVAPARFAELARANDWTDALIRRSVRHYVHPVGTARMGPAADPGAVVDQYGRVYGLAGLQIADASVMPTVPTANTHLTCVVIGERIAAWMRETTD